MKQLKPIIFSLLLVISVFSGFKMHKSEQALQQYKNDLIELSNVTYGILNVDTWENLLADIIVSKLDDFDSDEGDGEEMKQSISVLLKTLIDDYEKTVEKKNSGGLFASVKNSLYASAFDGIREDIPALTDKVMAFLDVKNNKEGIKQYIIVLLKKYTSGTFERTDYSKVNTIVENYEGENSDATVTILHQKLANENNANQIYKVLLLISFLGFIIAFFFSKHITKADYLLGILFSFLLLFLGISLPMIEIDARISEMSFSILEEAISFKNQVLFYKSKSIYEVVTLMMAQKTISLIVVGSLIFLFSVLFPITKLISSILYIINKKLKENKMIQFFIFKTGKWSMADVFVIAIMMTFIGFEGIVNDQLSQLKTISESVDILTTNNSSVLFGFYAFTAFVILSIAISHRIHKERS
ncbi:MAG: paraquat-inducible protein A [Polaribacter sp.]|nr:paraquat-inducible protein A [Polaribacter sp.]MDG1954517.1 paraquat-inducible protein A [Polaribacter sp.]